MKKNISYFFPFILFFINISAQLVSNQNNVIKIFIVRHAEKADTTKNPPLTEAGEIRAVKIANILSVETIDTVYSTNFTRTIETVNNVANARSLEVKKYSTPKELASLIKKTVSGKNYLVAVHSNTISSLVKEFGITHLPDNIEEYDNLFILVLINGKASLTRLKF